VFELHRGAERVPVSALTACPPHGYGTRFMRTRCACTVHTGFPDGAAGVFRAVMSRFRTVIPGRRRIGCINHGKTAFIKVRDSMRKLIWFKLLFTFVLLVALVKFIEVGNILAAFSRARAVWIAAAGILLAPNLFLQWLKWHLLVRRAHGDAAPRQTFSSLLTGISLGLVSPGRSGEFGRAWFLPWNPKAPLVGFTLIDKLYTQVAMVLTGLFSLLVLFQTAHGGSRAAAAAWILYGIVFFTALWVVAAPEHLAGAIVSLRWKLLRRRVMRRFLSCLPQFDRRTSIRIFALSAAFVFVYLLQFYVILRAFEEVAFSAGYLTLALVMFVTTFLPFFIGNLGIREVSAVFFLQWIGVPGESAFDSSLILFGINILIPALAGFLLFLLRKNGRQKPSTVP